MKIILNCMVRNEMAHMASAMAHFSTLFDEINVVDHRSNDGTLDGIKAWNSQSCKINGYTLDNDGYFQSDVMSFLARAQIRDAGADWVFFLDFDEYLPFRSRAEFEQALVQHAFHPAIKLRWHNLIPVNYGTSRHLGADYMVGPDASEYVKVAFQPKLLADHPDLVIEQGNHGIRTAPDGTILPAEFSVGLFHIPIDGLDHLQAKITTGLEACKIPWDAGQGELGRHWRLMDEALKTGRNQAEVLNSFVAHYGEDDFLKGFGEKTTPFLSEGEMHKGGYRRITLDLAGVDVTAAPAKPVANTAPDRVLTLSDQGKVIATPALDAPTRPASYKPADGVNTPALEGDNPLLAGIAAPADLDAFLARSFQRIDVFTPTAWGGHIPFMFALVETLRPRRFAELGSHYGASFFAACQTVKRLGMPTCGTAIDLWEGDPQAGFYGEEVYNSFEAHRTRHFASQSRSIRSYFADAAPRFADKSLDLIHIDGLHTFDAVKEDYDTWRPKLTDNGVIIFHDTNEYQSSFGVWDFFAKIRGQATASFEFKHTHGLGVMAFGDPAKNPMIGVLEMMNADPVKTERHFARMGELLIKEALFEFADGTSNGADRLDVPKIGRHYITDGDLLNTRSKMLFRIIGQHWKVRRERKKRQRARKTG